MILTALLIWTSKGAAVCIDEAAARYRVSPLLLKAIIQVESRGNPYAVGFCLLSARRKQAVNFLRDLEVSFSTFSSGKKACFSVFPESKEQAERILEFVSSSALTYDVGLMQINKVWIKKYSLRPEWLLDACYSVYWGAYVLAEMIDRYGYSWEAVWHYNGNRRYADKILVELERLCRDRRTDYCLELERYLGR